MELWLTRDTHGHKAYGLWRRKPVDCDGTFHTEVNEEFTSDLIKLFCATEWEEVTGMKLALGEIRRVESIEVDLYHTERKSE